MNEVVVSAPVSPTAPALETRPDSAVSLEEGGALSPITTRRRRRRFGRMAHVVLLAATVALLALFYDRLPEIGAGLTSALTAAGGAHAGWLVLVVVAEAGSMGAFARLQRRLLLGGGVRISRRRAFAVTYAGNALSTTLPAGPALSVIFSFKQFRRSGASAQLATAVILVGGIVTTSAYSLIALLALTAEPHSRIFAAAALGASAALVALGVLLWRRPAGRIRLTALARRLAGALSRHRRIAPLVDQLGEGWNSLGLTRNGWGAITTLSLVNWLFDILALIAATRAVGIELPIYGVALAYFAAQAAGSLLPILPGGLGAIESSMVAALMALGAGLGPAGAAVGLYRLVSFWAVVTVGWLAWAMLRDPGPRLPRVPRARMASLGRATLASLGAGAGVVAYSATHHAMRSVGGHGTR